MSAHTGSATPLAHCVLPGGTKICVLAVTLSASYDAGGSILDLSTAGLLGAALGFQTVTAVAHAGHVTAASSKYDCVYVPAALNAPATGLIKVHDSSQAANAEASGDLHATVVRVVIVGT